MESGTIAEFIAASGITMTATPALDNPDAADEFKDASHWRCTLTVGRRTMVVAYSQGAAHRQWNAKKVAQYYGTYTKAEIAKFSPTLGGSDIGGAPESIALRELREQCSEPTPPELASVLDCLASDASSVENAGSFEEWAGEYGYDTDSRKAERVYLACERQTRELRRLLGHELYGRLLWHTDRD